MGGVNRRYETTDSDYPSELREVPKPPGFTVDGEFSPAPLRVAIVGSRTAGTVVLALARRLAAAVVKAGGVVVSGGALGVDSAAHSGALEAGGRTWSVLGCGPPHFTDDRKEFFEGLVAQGGTLIRPFPENTKPSHRTFPARNRVLVALSQIVVVAQAARRSGSLNSARWARDLDRELWVVPGPPSHEFEGSWWILDHYKAKMLRSEKEFEETLYRRAAPAPTLEGDAVAVYRALESGPKHPDEVADETGLSTPAVTTALLTLALGDVVVEGSSGLFERKKLVTG